MWTCPKCGRLFKNTNQSHYCSSKPADIDQYIAQSPEERREILQRVRQTIREAAPGCTEKISWDMPTFFQGENLIHFAVSKNHLGLYPGEDGVNAFARRLQDEGYKFNKGTIQLPWNKPIPYELIAEITRYRVMKASG
jgi:uncharacterized protein YdhG (YjbR/CyaY superfamily)